MTFPARSSSTLTALLGLAALTAIAGCSQSARPRASAAATQKCRVEVDRVYSAQNRVDLSTRDSRDTPFASNYLSGITSRGLGAQYGRDNMTQACVNEALAGSPAPAASGAPAAAAASTGPTFSTTPSSSSK